MQRSAPLQDEDRVDSCASPTLLQRTASRDHSPRWMAAAFAGGILALGMLSAGLSFAAQPESVGSNAPQVYPALYPPDWVFWTVWLVIYPCWGAATWFVWRRRQEVNLRSFWRYFGLILIVNLAFLPISALTHGNPTILTVLDATGIILLPLTAWMYGRYARPALYWLLPMFIWGPITLALKIWLTLLNRG